MLNFNHIVYFLSRFPPSAEKSRRLKWLRDRRFASFGAFIAKRISILCSIVCVGPFRGAEPRALRKRNMQMSAQIPIFSEEYQLNDRRVLAKCDPTAAAPAAVTFSAICIYFRGRSAPSACATPIAKREHTFCILRAAAARQKEKWLRRVGMTRKRVPPGKL